MSTKRAPKVFISYASEDKDRFVTGFATRLREEGVDAWYAEWEILPGHSLVDKIFEEGIGHADAMIVVLSSHSVDKPWVREELNAGVVRRIVKGMRLIPLVLDNCSVPESLKPFVWQKIDDPTSYDSALARVVASIFGQIDRPSLGPVPRYASTLSTPITGLTATDSLVLKAFCERAVETGDDIAVDTEEVWNTLEPHDLPQAEFEDSLRVLSDERLLIDHNYAAEVQPAFKISTSGFVRYAESCLPEYPELVRHIAALLVNEEVSENTELVRRLEANKIIVDVILRDLHSRGYITIDSMAGGFIAIVGVKPQLRRRLIDRF